MLFPEEFSPEECFLRRRRYDFLARGGEERLQMATIHREFWDVVLEDVGFDNDSLLKTEGVGTSHLKLI